METLATQTQPQLVSDSVQFLERELKDRIRKNPSYSLRAFSSSLDMDVGTLSRLISGKRKLSIKVATRLFDRLRLSEDEQIKVIRAIERERIREKIHSAKVTHNKTLFIDLEQEAFMAISNWYHYAILQMTKTCGFRRTDAKDRSAYIASKLGIAEEEAEKAISRMLALGLLKDINGELKATAHTPVVANKRQTNSALINLQRELRQKAIQSLENDPIEARAMTSSTIAIKKEKLDEAKELIYQFQKDFRAFLETGDPDDAYQLTISFFPLERK